MVKKEKDYTQGKIYKIWSNNTNMIYIGSTCKTKKERLDKHISNFNCYCRGSDQALMTSFYILDNDHFDIDIIELFPCENEKELIDRESHYIRKNKDICVNKIIPNRSEKEWKTENYKLNKELINAKNKQYWALNKDKMHEANRQYRLLNKDKIKEQKTKNYLCECGSNIQFSEKSRHFRTKKHLNYLKDL
jgi:hypothetical protein